MSDKYYGNIVSPSDNLPVDNFESTSAPGVWTLEQAAQLKVQGLWPTKGITPPTYWFAIAEPPLGFSQIFSMDLEVDSSGNIYSSGYTSPSAGPSQAGLSAFKLNYQGTPQWNKLYTSDTYSKIFQGNTMNFDGSGDLAIGCYPSGGTAITEFVTISTDGSTLTEEFALGDAGSINGPVIGSSTTNYIFAGYRSANSLKSFYARFNSSGTLQASDYGRVFNNRPYGYVITMKNAVLDSSNNLYAQWGNIYEGGYIKYTSSGSVAVCSMLGGGGYASNIFGMCFEQGSNPSNFYAVGKAYPNASAHNLFKVSTSNGTSTSWSTQFTNVGNSMRGTVDSSNTYLYHVTQSSTSGNLVLSKIATSNGAISWSREIDFSTANLGFPAKVEYDNTNGAIILSGNVTYDNVTRVYVLRLPDDGSGAGTYGDWTYSSYSITTTTSQGSWSSCNSGTGSSPVSASTTGGGTYSDTTFLSYDREAGPT